jgi:hypothetical protein
VIPTEAELARQEGRACEPAQIIAKLCRVNRAGSITCLSSLGKGHSIVLFDVEAAEMIQCRLVQVISIDLGVGNR